jgi:hypothetical protein
MGTKYGPVYEDDAADLGRGIPEQTDEEAANEAAMNSPAARARRKISDAENEIRANAAAKLETKAAPTIAAPTTEISKSPDLGNEGRRTSMEVGPAAKRTPMVTKEQLAASGLSLRDYLNKQQGLTRRGDSAPSASPSKATTPPGSSLPPSRALMPNKEGQPGGSLPVKRPRGQGTVMEQGRGVDMYGSTLSDIKNMFKGTRRGGSEYAKGGAVKKMASGGSVSSASKRADGIAIRGKTKGRMC